jgi:hypothetical protein
MKTRLTVEEKFLTQRLNLALRRPLQLSQVKAETELVESVLAMVRNMQARKTANTLVRYSLAVQ